MREWWTPEVGDVFLSNENVAVINYVGENDFRGVEDVPYTDDAPYDKAKCLPLLSVGQMIELLFSCRITRRYFERSLKIELSKYGALVLCGNDELPDGEKDELCDALWQSVKAVL